MSKFLKKDNEKDSSDLIYPLKILIEEHKILLEFAIKLKEIVLSFQDEKRPSHEDIEVLGHIINHFRESESHYLREENVLFPYLEKHGITQPPMIMWSEHQEIRKRKGELYQTFEELSSIEREPPIKKLRDLAIQIEALLQSHFLKENNILFPASQRVITDKEWKEIKKGFDDIGYCCFTPGLKKKEEEKKEELKLEKDELITFPTGSIKIDEMEAILNTLPVDITFVDKDDKVRYFSESKDRIFVRTKAVIGRNVQNCHPQESLHRVQKILDDFKNGARDVAEFWINYRGKMIHIRYFPLRDRKGKYLGCLEVTQDITEIKKIEGEKRLIDE